MRGSIVVAVLLTGCGQGQFFSPEKIAERREAYWQEQAREAARQAAFNASPEGIAFQGCQFRANAAMQGWRARSILDLEGTARGNQLMDQCMNYWRRTGQLP